MWVWILVWMMRQRVDLYFWPWSIVIFSWRCTPMLEVTLLQFLPFYFFNLFFWIVLQFCPLYFRFCFIFLPGGSSSLLMIPVWVHLSSWRGFLRGGAFFLYLFGWFCLSLFDPVTCCCLSSYLCHLFWLSCCCFCCFLCLSLLYFLFLSHWIMSFLLTSVYCASLYPTVNFWS